MKLATVTTYATPRNMRRELLAEVARRGHSLTLIAPQPTSTMGPAMGELGGAYVEWRVDRAGIAPFQDARAALELAKILRLERPDIVLVYQIKAVLIAPTAARLAGVGRIVALVNGLGSVFDEQGFGATWKAALARRLYGLSLRNTDAIVFQNSDDPRLLQTLGIMPKHAHWSVVPGSGVDLSALRALPMHSSPPTFSLISRLLVSKGVRDFVEAARVVRSRNPSARFLLVGPLEPAHHPDSIGSDEIRRWETEGLIEYLGVTDDVARVLASTSVFVLPSYYREGVPRTNLEALAAGRPVITTDSVGCRETVEDGRNGFLIPPRDPTALAARMQCYLDDVALLERHGHASRVLAETRFDVRLVNQMMLQTLGLDREPA